jgi:cation diffusion facilitator CzcD-associated flavoprotein CzcO
MSSATGPKAQAPSDIPASDTGPVDADALRAKYRQERDKRLRSDGNSQYREPTGALARFLDDPHVVAEDRPPVHDHVTFAFVGGGFAGLVTGAAVQQRGIGTVRIIEKGGDFGGTWYWNRYPGAQCDTASMVYLPLLEETGHVPTEKYVHAPEILAHCQRIGRHFGLYEHALLSTEVTGLIWDQTQHHWRITTNRGDDFTADYVGMGTGPLHRPKLPGIAGIENFAGHSFHTSRWDYAYTGGDPSGAPLTGLADKRVGIIGTGATAVQCIPHLARWSAELLVFQRTPSSIDARNNEPIDPVWFSTLGPGWQRRWLRNFTTLQTGGFADEDLVMDGWTELSRRIRDRMVEMNPTEFTREAFLEAYRSADDQKMEEIRARVEAIVDDPATAEALKPWYRQLCKRPCFHDRYLQAFNEPAAKLIDTDGKGVQSITAQGVIVNDTLYELDLLVYATGFEVGTTFQRRSGFDTVGQDGRLLSEHWQDGMRSLHGIHVHGFPNLFVVSPAQGANLISNVPHNLIEAAETIGTTVAHAHASGRSVVAVTEQAEDDWVEMLRAGNRSFGADPDCTPGYYNNEGHPGESSDQLTRLGFPEGPVAYFDYIDEWRRRGTFDGLTFTRP